MSKIVAILLLAVSYSLCSVSNPAAQNLEDAARCVQAFLNDLGRDVGAVDGVIGAGTRSAFEDYKQMLPRSIAGLELTNDTLPAWCLFMSQQGAQSEQANQLAEAVASESTATIRVLVPESAEFVVDFMGSDDNVLARAEDFRWQDDLSPAEHRASLPYIEIQGAERFCARFRNGWVVRDQDGNPYAASCTTVDQLNQAFFVGGFVGLNYVVDRQDTSGTPSPNFLGVAFRLAPNMQVEIYGSVDSDEGMREVFRQSVTDRVELYDVSGARYEYYYLASVDEAVASELARICVRVIAPGSLVVKLPQLDHAADEVCIETSAFPPIERFRLKDAQLVRVLPVRANQVAPE